MNKINLGDEVRDKITGFKGIAIARTEWLTGCARITIQPKVDKDGKLNQNETFDEPMLIVIKPVTKVKEPTFKGGPRPEIYQKNI